MAKDRRTVRSAFPLIVWAALLARGVGEGTILAGDAVDGISPPPIVASPVAEGAVLNPIVENSRGLFLPGQPAASESTPSTIGSLCGTESCPAWVPSCGLSPDGGITFQWSPDQWCNIDALIRTSVNSVTDSAPRGGNYFAIDNLRLYFTGKVTQVIGFELNTDISGAGNRGFTDTANDSLRLPDTIHLLDADIRFEFNDYVNIWAGRFRPPSDRTNLSGPFYINAWDLPFVSKYPSIFLGRDDGAAYWGQYAGGQLKWQVGLFDGPGRVSAGNDFPPNPPAISPNTSGDPLFAMRVVANLLDPEPGYYNFSTYYGEKNILAIGFALQAQQNAFEDAAHHVGAFTGWNFDFLLENKMAWWGSGTLEAAYYNYDVSGNVASPIAGQSGFVYAGLLLPQEIGCCGVCGRFRPFVRYQRYDYHDPAAAAVANEFSEGWDFGVDYIIKGHNARINNFVGTRDIVGGGREDIYRTGVQFVF
jgi:hypothetical protein